MKGASDMGTSLALVSEAGSSSIPDERSMEELSDEELNQVCGAGQQAIRIYDENSMLPINSGDIFLKDGKVVQWKNGGFCEISSNP